MAFSSGSGGGYASDINVVPMIDVMLVLLIVFMITAPMLTTGVDVDLPEVPTANVEDPEGKLTLSIDADRNLYLGATPIRWAELQEKLSTNERVRKERELYIEADKQLPYAVVVTAMAVAREAGVIKLQMLTDPGAQLDLSALDAELGGAPAPPPGGGADPGGGGE
jgi:biopolymer transport protein TolR